MIFVSDENSITIGSVRILLGDNRNKLCIKVNMLLGYGCLLTLAVAQRSTIRIGKINT